MIPRSRLNDEQKEWLRYIASRDQADAAARDFATATVVRCRLCDAEHRSTVFKKPSECVNCGHPLGKDGAA
jgi:hypothetical protein